MTDWRADLTFWGMAILIAVVAVAAIAGGFWLLLSAPRVWVRIAGLLLVLAGAWVAAVEIVMALIAKNMAPM